MISTPTALQSVKLTKARSAYMKLMLVPLKMHSTGLTYLEGRIISKVKSGNTELFAKLKAGR